MAKVNLFYKKMVNLGVRMLNYIWCAIIIVSVVCSVFTGRTDELSNEILNSANDAVRLIITMTGTVCLWSGLMEIADRSGASEKIAKLLSPALSRLFPDLDRNTKAFSAISANVTANLLGLGNAATPLGIKAMRELEKERRLGSGIQTADRNMVMFVILNTTSIQLMPTMIISILKSCGNQNPTEIIPYVWIASVFGMAVGIFFVNLFYRELPAKRIRYRGKKESRVI